MVCLSKKRQCIVVGAAAAAAVKAREAVSSWVDQKVHK